ncbi:zinc metallopeptidase [Bacillus hominis]|uniref:Zinc metallopeptidase n=1 Tax=Bacillus hominis TaxID=2817478 RepID=A0ABT7RA08_9BACI|nr:zinc metallopeptidase [Bacillus hominis]MDM5194640.1 zinc metallopeptidase [Bacillus hominis]MDM5439758.1 zinc metallopeptidase [Bacillus hominis]SCM96240.1 Putative metalloprotease [Bacillus mycoides]
MLFHPMDFLILIAFGLSIWAQFKVKGNFNKWSEVNASSGLSGAEVARKILDNNGLYHVPIEVVPGRLSDHYDPMVRVVRLSEDVYYGNSIASVSVAAHEVEHAIQHDQSYGFLSLRHKMFPIANIASGIAPFLLLGGFLFQAFSLIGIGIIFFSAAVAFQLITLPVEFNASARAKQLMLAEGMISDQDTKGVNKVLGAAALTYVAATLISVLELVKYVMIFFQGNEED